MKKCFKQNGNRYERKFQTLYLSGQSILKSIVRHSISIHGFAVQMYSLNPRPNKEFCTEVAKMLVKKHDLMNKLDTSFWLCELIIMYYKLEPAIKYIHRDYVIIICEV